MKRSSILCGLLVLLILGGATLRAEDVRIYRPEGDTTAPSTSSASGTTTTVAPPATPIPRAIPVTPLSVPNPITSYKVEKGDSLWKISQKVHVSIAAIKEANHLTDNNIRVGSVLKIPSLVPEEIRRAIPVGITQAPLPPIPTPALVPPVPASSGTATPTVPTKGVPALLPPQSSTPSASTALPPYTTQEVVLQKKFVEETRQLALAGVAYDSEWQPPGEDGEWAMDCSNTTRYLYRKVTGIGIERTASDQYYDLQQKGIAWDVPLTTEGGVDKEALFSQLEIGDLLFWKNTYKPERDPPITHVMIYLGKNKEGQYLMAGSQMGGGFFNVSGSGPDIYLFDPAKRVGGFSTNLGFTHIRGSFVAFGRPLLDKPDLKHGVEVASAN